MHIVLSSIHSLDCVLLFEGMVKNDNSSFLLYSLYEVYYITREYEINHVMNELEFSARFYLKNIEMTGLERKK